jgi:hypothetical protein
MSDRVKIRLNIDDISEDTYQNILFDFREQFGKDFFYDEWEITAIKQKERKIKRGD